MAIRAGQIIRALDFAGYGNDFDQTDETFTDNVNYLPGSSVIGFTFIAPSSGAVKAGYSARMRQTDVDGQRMLILPEVREGAVVGSGTVVNVFTEDAALEIGGPVLNLQLNAAQFQVVTGLSPGATYNVRLLHKVGAAGGSVTIFARALTTEPMQL